MAQNKMIFMKKLTIGQVTIGQVIYDCTNWATESFLRCERLLARGRLNNWTSDDWTSDLQLK